MPLAGKMNDAAQWIHFMATTMHKAATFIHLAAQCIELVPGRIV